MTWKTMTKEEKQEYAQQQNESKKHLQELYEKFLTEKKLKDVMQIVCNAKQLHKMYSWNNTILAYIQGSKMLGGHYQGVLNSYLNWNKQKVSVLQGSKGIKILVPVSKKVYKDNGGKVINESEIMDGVKLDYFTFFKIGNVFDISQTSAYNDYLKDMQEKDEQVYSNYNLDFNMVYNWIKSIYPYEIIQDVNNGECKGSYNPLTHIIKLHQLTAHTLIHEYSHWLTITKLNLTDNNKTLYAKNEILAEISTYIIMHKIDSNCQYNFNYSNLWASNLTAEFKANEFNGLYKKLTEAIKELKVPSIV